MVFIYSGIRDLLGEIKRWEKYSIGYQIDSFGSIRFCEIHDLKNPLTKKWLSSLKWDLFKSFHGPQRSIQIKRSWVSRTKYAIQIAFGRYIECRFAPFLYFHWSIIDENPKYRSQFAKEDCHLRNLSFYRIPYFIFNKGLSTPKPFCRKCVCSAKSKSSVERRDFIIRILNVCNKLCLKHNITKESSRTISDPNQSSFTEEENLYWFRKPRFYPRKHWNSRC